MRLKSRKWTAFILTAAMAVVSPVSVLADEPAVENEPIVTEETPKEENKADIGMETPGESNTANASIAEGSVKKPEEETKPDDHVRKPGEGSETGVGEVEGSVDTDVYQVVLPTVGNNAFDFIMDPQGLINKTNGAAYEGKTFEPNSTLFFKRTDGKAPVDYSSTSDEIKITNRGSSDIDVSLHISISPESLCGIQLSGDREFLNDTSTSIYLALVDGEHILPIGSEGIDMSVTVSAAPEEAYEYGYDKAQGEYTYQLRENVDGIEFDSYSFQITGAANGKGDWSKLTEVKPQIQVSWKIVSKEGEGQ